MRNRPKRINVDGKMSDEGNISWEYDRISFFPCHLVTRFSGHFCFKVTLNKVRTFFYQMSSIITSFS